MGTTSRKIFTKAQRVRIYNEALKSFTKMAEHREKQGLNKVTGMCEHVERAVRVLGFKCVEYRTSLNSVNFPEYFSYKPKSTWLQKTWSGYMEYTGFWWSTKTPKGRECRLAIMRRLAEGKSKGE